MIKQQVLDIQDSKVDSYTEEQEALNKYDAPSKRANTSMSFVSPFPYNGNSTGADTTDMMQIDTITSQGKALSSISQEPSGINTLSNSLQMISRSKEDVIIISDNVLGVCHLFVYDYTEQYILNNKCTQLIGCINLLLYGVNMMPQNKMTGLIAASFILG